MSNMQLRQLSAAMTVGNQLVNLVAHRKIRYTYDLNNAMATLPPDVQTLVRGTPGYRTARWLVSPSI